MTVFPEPNGYYPLPVNEPTYNPAEKFEPQKILHYVLSIEAAASSTPNSGPTLGELKFVLLPVGGITHAPADILTYAKTLDLKRDLGHSMVSTSPYDIDVREQVILAIELDNRINWQFTEGTYAVTTRAFYGKSNFGLHNVYPKDSANGANTVEFDDVICRSGCRLVYFSIFSRRGDQMLQKFNFHVEFLQSAGAVSKRLVVIIDPDIKNEGLGFPQ